MKPKIYVFSNVPGGGDGACLALAEDGTVLGSHWCSHEEWAKHDLGVIEGSRPDRHKTYAAHYPSGYEMVFVPSSDVRKHDGITAAYALNQKQRETDERESAAP
jgi:hypothetical protein